MVIRENEPGVLGTALMGDRIQVNSMEIIGIKVLVDMVTHGPEDPMTSPTRQFPLTYRMVNGQLELLESEIIMDPTNETGIDPEIIETTWQRANFTDPLGHSTCLIQTTTPLNSEKTGS